LLQTIMMRILIVEDEEHLADLLAEVLGREGHVAKTASDGRSGLTRALSEDFDLLVVDWMLPDLDGVQVVKRLRAADVRVPILMLTARAQVEDRVEGLDAGADDYRPKPFAFPELLARVRALSRRPPENETEGTVLTAGDVALDPVRHEVRCAGERLDLTAKEFALLATLMQRPGQVFTRSVLLDTVWGGAPPVLTPTWSTYIFTTCARSSTRAKNPPGSEPCTARDIPSTRDQNTQDRTRLKGKNQSRKRDARENALAPDAELRGHLCAHPPLSSDSGSGRLLAGTYQPAGHTPHAGG
jgi:DNA-binding response OmpR family regulator